jgi:hypothetical protein
MSGREIEIPHSLRMTTLRSSYNGDTLELIFEVCGCLNVRLRLGSYMSLAKNLGGRVG